MRKLFFIPLVLAGCGPGIEPSFESSAPQARNMAIVAEVRKGSGGDPRQLVRMLDAKEASTRLLAIEGLERMTGERLGYDYAAGERERREAVERWRAWVETRERASRDGSGSHPTGGAENAR